MPGRPTSVPPLPVLLRLLGLDGATDSVPDDGRMVTLPFGMLRLLLRGALAGQPFDEDRYLRLNADVAAAVLRGDIASGQEHYAANGYLEGRDGGGETFAETWYLVNNPDIAAAVGAGQFASGLDHYLTAGMFELRAPNPACEADMADWRACREAASRANAAACFEPIQLDAVRRRAAQ